MLNNIKNIYHDIEAPVRLFSILKKQLAITKGTILILDVDRNIYLPWASTGLDPTTMHRLRLTDKELRSLVISDNGNYRLVTGKQLDIFKPYFSIREFSILERVLLLPISYNHKPIAFLLMTDSLLFEYGENEISEFFKKVHEPIRSLIVASRQEKLERLQYNLYYSKANVLEELSKMVQYAYTAQKHLLTISLPLDSIINHILETISDAEPYRVKEDVIKILASMIPGNGKVFPAKENNVILALSQKTTPNPKLLIHQMIFALKGFFHLLEGLPDVDYQVRIYPQDGDNVNDLLTGLL